VKNALTVDLEDYFQVTAFASTSSAADWDSLVSRVEANTLKLLDLLSSANCHATFFVVGWVAEKYPRLIRQIAELGHEIACHSHMHRFVYSLTPAEFKADTRRAIQALQDASGVAVRGYRAPSFSITRDSWWAFEVLAELGFTYDSSIFPVKHIDYGMPDGPRFPFRVSTPAGPIFEFPMSTLAFGRARSPFAGGAYFRFLPFAYTSWAIRYVNREEHSPVCFYLHPWELDSEQPRMEGSLTSRARQYFGLRKTEAKLSRLLREFDFCPLATVLEELLNSPRGVQKFVLESQEIAVSA
jgi:polysaccharide deacetylase family protein (PEP-CTERM system associated)